MERFETPLAAERLMISGIVPLASGEGWNGARTVLLLSPHEPGFWSHVTASPEYADGRADPLDRWSRRVIEGLADRLGATAAFPFGGPPHQPFVDWALRSGRFHLSPVGLLIHDRMGLWASFRGALLITQALPPMPVASPCETCAAKPCLTACPPRALTESGYDLPACHAYLDTDGGQACLRGCAVRRACPVSAGYGRLQTQSAHHMGYFHR